MDPGPKFLRAQKLIKRTGSGSAHTKLIRSDEQRNRQRPAGHEISIRNDRGTAILFIVKNAHEISDLLFSIGDCLFGL
ncbi:hypothetical protein HanXRQr2_Chr07g0278961 [Helianthus annuus]|uniref:Uncharacterized protein n=1 Tax=Helianthus annuus TaxID=4232 RepID=A0A251TB87_HELAN|nr:hypothetical protein HanXRQr2_Chr07g0278961 [Helianthus annuus]